MNTSLVPFTSIMDRMFQDFIPVYDDTHKDPYTRILSHEDSWDILFGVPGSSKEDFSVSVDRGKLFVDYTPKENAFIKGTLYRSWSLPKGHPEEVEAQFENGVLTIKIPRPKPTIRHIAIH